MLSKDFHPPPLLCPVMLRDMAGEKGIVRYKQTDMMLFSTPPSLRTPPLSHIRAQRRSTTHFLAFIVFYATRQNILTFSLAVSRSIAGCFCGAKYRGETEER